MSLAPHMDALDHAANILRMFDIEPHPLDRLVDRYFRHHREIGSKGRRLIADAVFGVSRWRRRIDGFCSLAGIREPSFRERAALYLRWQRPEGKDIAASSRDPARDLGAIDLGAAMPARFPGGVAGYHSFPDDLYRRLSRQYGEEGAAELAEHLNRPAHPTLRVNTLRTDREAALAWLSESGMEAFPTERSPFGIRLASREDLASTEIYRSGVIEVQDEASQLAVLAADPQPGERVLDACAGAGGKALMMAMLMRGEGRVDAADIDRPRLQELRRRKSRAGAGIIHVLSSEEEGTASSKKAGGYDLVFIDAPCTGTGTLRRNPDLRWRLSPAILRERTEVQRTLLEEHAGVVRSGGRLCYATCSLLCEENEEIVEGLLRRGVYEVMDVREPLARHGIPDDGLVTPEGYLMVDPRKGEWDGFFAALLRRK
jgi:16S rRNA (cytosine967-C5)-methyltransferase